MNDTSHPSPAGLGKRLLAIIYDLFLLAAWLFIAEILPVALNHGNAISRDNGLIVFYLLHPLYLLIMCFAFLGWFWTHGGQTLGMKTWKLKLVSLQGGNMSWRQAGDRVVTRENRGRGLLHCLRGIQQYYSNRRHSFPVIFEAASNHHLQVADGLPLFLPCGFAGPKCRIQTHPRAQSQSWDATRGNLFASPVPTLARSIAAAPHGFRGHGGGCPGFKEKSATSQPP